MLISGQHQSHSNFARLQSSSATPPVAPVKQSDAGDAEAKKNTEEKKLSAQPSSSEVSRAEINLDEAELKQLRELRARDREVRAHEQAHASVAGTLAKGGPSFSFQRGPDGQRYAVGGEVQIDTSAVSGDPKATIEKAQQIRRAALAPANPSSQDRAVAAQATSTEARARIELAQQSAEATKLKSEELAAKTEASEIDEEPAHELRESASKCAVCGGHHSAESHVASNEALIASTFSTTESDKSAAALLDISV